MMEKFFTKITSLILAMMILMSSMSTTIVYAVEELEGENNSITESTNTTDEESGSLQNELKDETTNNANEKEENNESQSSNTEDSSKQEGSTGLEDGDSTLSEESKDDLSEDSQSSLNSDDQSMLDEDKELNRAKSLRNSNLKSTPDAGDTGNTANVQNAENESGENQGEESNANSGSSVNEIKPTTKQEIEDLKANNKFKTKNDKHEIRIFASPLISGASKDSNGNLVWTAGSSSAGHEFTFRVNYALSGVGELAEGSMQITIPKKVLRDKEGNFANEFIMSLPTLEEYKQQSGTTDFVYKEDEDYIIVYNPKEITAAVNGYFEVSYTTSKSTFNYKDYDAANAGKVVDGGTASDPFYAILSVNVGDDTLHSITDDTLLYINTTAKVTSTQKRYPTIYRSWDQTWMEEVPEDSDEYYYLIWEIKSYIGGVTQLYNFTLDDFVTDLTEGTTGEDYQIVGYKLSGEKFYSQKNRQENQTLDDYRYDYVLTRHKISTYSPLTYELKNTAIVTVDPIDQVDNDTKQTSTNTFSWDPSFIPPNGQFNLFKYGNNSWKMRFNYYWDYASYDLDKFQNYQDTGVTSLSGFKYFTETIGYSYPWTIREGGSTFNPEDYGVNNVTYDVWDDSLFLEEDENKLTTNDYYLDYFTYSVTNTDAEYDDFSKEFKSIPVVYAEDENVTFYAKFGESTEWVEIGKYDLNTKQITVTSDNVAEMTTDKVVFKEGVHATSWRFTTTNKHYHTYIVVIPYYVLTNTEHVQNQIRGKDKVKLENDVSTNITDHNGNLIFEKTDKAFDYARVTYYSSSLGKGIASVSNNRAKSLYTITWKVRALEKATSGAGDEEYVWQDSGTFYDLIPQGGTIDLSSIQVQTQEGYLDENEYTYEIIENYNNSGRIMLIVRVKEQAQYYNVYYSTMHTWEDMKDYGRSVLNPVAYETGNDHITNGYADDGGNLSLANRILLKDLDKETDAKRFLYAESRYTINALTAAASGLNKKVKAEKSSTYSYNAEVEPEGSYSYRLRYQNTYMNKSKNLVLFDSLENYKVENSVDQTTKTSGWRGTIQMVDLTQLKDKGIDAKLYISTVENLNLEENNDVGNAEVWQLVTEETDLSTAKAIAIDMSKTTEGEDFVLDAGDSVTATIHMKAPAEVTEEIEENPYAYNNVYIKNTLIDTLENTEDYFIHQDYTRVKYHVIADVLFRKVNEQDESEGIKGITFRLYGTSRYGTDIDTYATSDKDGYVTFKDIEAGTYTLQESEGLIDWVEDHTEHTVQINADRSVYIDERLVENKDTVKITNKPRAHTDVEIYKKDLVSKGKVVEGAKLKLEGKSDYGTEILMYATSGADGKVVFSNVEKGKYKLTEVEAPEGYILGEEEYQVVVDEDSNYNVLEPIKGKIETRYSHTQNIDDTGYATSNYTNNLSRTDTIKIDGAMNLNVEVYYSTQSLYYDWVCVYDGNVTPTSSNYSSSISGRLGGNSKSYSTVNNGGYQTECSKWTGTIEGDTANLYFRSNYSGVYYGYYAIITAVLPDEIKEYKSTYVNGKYEIYNEPLHSFTVVKKDAYDNSLITGAKFKLSGISDYETSYNMEIVSGAGGLAEFSGLESGTYILQETYVPDVTDGGGNTISYVLDKNQHIVTINKDGTVSISGLGKNEFGNFEFYNSRNKGQITITKEWIDDSNNEERPEPTIKISTEKPQKSNYAYFRDNYSGYGPLYYLTNSSNYQTRITGEFKRNTTLTEEEVVALGAKRLDKYYNSPDAENKIYGWIDSSGNCYWWSNAEVAFLTDNSNRLFYNLIGVKSIDLTGIDTSNVTDMGDMFYECIELENVNLSSLDTSNVTDMSFMFYDCRALRTLDLSSFDTTNVKNMSYMFFNCDNLTSLNIRGINTSNVTNMTNMFYECRLLTSLDVSSFDTSNVTDMSFMFEYCIGLTELDLSNFNTSKVTNMRRMFGNCDFTSVDVSSFDTSNVTDMAGLFYYCYFLRSLDVSNFDTSNVVYMNQMFYACGSLESLDISNFDTSKVISMYNTFFNCGKLKTIYVSDSFVTEQVTNSGNMFYNSTKLVGGKGTRYSSAHVDKEYARIDAPGTPGYFTEKNPQTGSLNTNNMNLNMNMKLATVNSINGMELDDVSVTVNRTGYLQTTHMLAGNTEGTDSDGEGESTSPITYSTSETNYDDEGNEIHWVKNGDIWTYTFYVDDPYATWYVWEDSVADGYMANYTVDKPGTVENKEAKVVNYKYEAKDLPGEEPVIKYGSLAITKVLTDEDGNTILPEDDNTEFTLTVKLDVPKAYKNMISGIKVFGNYVFKDGVGMIKLHAGETATIPGLISGASYTVVEKDLDGYETTYDSDSGTITTNTESVVTYTNIKKPEGAGGSGEPDTQHVDITLKKVVTGHFEDDVDHKFEITLSNLVSNKEYKIEKYSADNQQSAAEQIGLVSDDSGMANITLNLRDGEKAILKAIPVGAKYKVFEYEGDYISSYTITDSNDKGLISNTAALNTKVNKSLATANETADEGEDVTITFANKKEVTQNLKLVNTVTDEANKSSYIFEIEFSNMEEGTTFNSSVGKITADLDGKATLTVNLAGGEEVEFYKLPVGTKYKIRELASTAITSYTVVDSNGGNKIEKELDGNPKAKMALNTELETVNQNEEAVITFVNDITNVDEEDAQDKVEVSIGVTKMVVDENSVAVNNCEDTFKFKLEPKDKTSPMPESSITDNESIIKETTVKGNGTASFGTIVFTETGTYVYTITELKENTDNYEYDETVYTVTYEVTNPEGLLELTKTVTKNGFRGDVIAFTNVQKYKPSEDEPSEDSKDPEEGNKSEESKESSENKDNKENTNNAQANNVKTGDVVVIYIANIIVVGAILVISIKCRRKYIL